MVSPAEDYATNPDLRTALREPFPAHLITRVDKGFGKVDTLNHAVVTDRLNSVAPAWHSTIERVVEIEGTDGMPHVLAVYGTLTIGSVTRFEVGEVEHPSTYGDELKKALSDFIKRAAMRFGVGIDLWSKEDMRPTVTVDLPDTPAPPGGGAGTAVVSPPEETRGGGTDGGDTAATLEQWEALRAVVGGSQVKAVNRLNRVNGTAYTKATAVHATAAEVAAAITGGP